MRQLTLKGHSPSPGIRAADKSVCCRRMSLPTCHCMLQTPHLPVHTCAPYSWSPPAPLHPVCWKFHLFFMLLGLSMDMDGFQ